MRAPLVLLLLLFGIDFADAEKEPERSEAPKAYRNVPSAESFPIKIGPLQVDIEHAHSQLQHSPKDVKAEPRIVGGVAAAPNQYQFFTRIDSNDNPYCGGSLVSSDVIMTAGHCFTDALSVVVNGYSLYSSDGTLQYQREIVDTIRHPDFNPTTYENDVMLLKLSEPVDTEYISLNFNDENPQVGDDLIVMGLGNKEEDGAPASSLQAATVQVISHDICEENYREVGLDNVDDDIMLCAGNTVEGNKDVRCLKSSICRVSVLVRILLNHFVLPFFLGLPRRLWRTAHRFERRTSWNCLVGCRMRTKESARSVHSCQWTQGLAE